MALLWDWLDALLLATNWSSADDCWLQWEKWACAAATVLNTMLHVGQVTDIDGRSMVVVLMMRGSGGATLLGLLFGDLSRKTDQVRT